jgi:hypothetical protein
MVYKSTVSFQGEERPIVFAVSAWMRAAREVGESQDHFLHKRDFDAYELYALIFSMFRQAALDKNQQFYINNLTDFIAACSEDEDGFAAAAEFFSECSLKEADKADKALKAIEEESKKKKVKGATP